MTNFREIEILELGAANAEAFAELRRELTSDNPVPMGLSFQEELGRSIEGFRNQLSLPAPNAVFGAFIAGELVGCSAITWLGKFPSSQHKAMLWGILVSPRYRRLGIGRMMVERAISHARSNVAKRVNLTVYIPNESAVALYESFGFETYGIEPDALHLDGKYYAGQQMSLSLNRP